MYFFIKRAEYNSYEGHCTVRDTSEKVGLRTFVYFDVEML